jgi:hypothetical protein
LKFDVAIALHLIASLVSFAVLLSSLELFYLAGKGEFSEGGVWDWRILRSVSLPRSRYFDPLMRWPHSFTVLLLIRCFAAFLLTTVGIQGRFASEAILALALCQVILNNRLIWGDDGSDQMISLILVALFLYKATGSRLEIGILSVLFISAQLTLCYVSSGLAKLCGAEWRRGVALRNIMGHHSYGNRQCYEFLRRFPWISRVTGYGAMFFMITFPVYFVLPTRWSLLYLAWGVSFHVGVAAIMRLNGFLTAFLSGYPALAAAHYLVYHAVFA